MQADDITKSIPIIFMTSLTDAVDKIKGLSLGAVDYITKPFQSAEVIARIGVHLKLRHLTKQLEEQNTLLQNEVRSRQLAEFALRVSEEKFSKAFRLNPGSMMMVSLQDNRLIEVNQHFCTALGYNLEEIYGRTLDDLNLWVNLSDRDRFYQDLQTTGNLLQREFQVHTKSGAIRQVIASAEQIRIGKTPCALVVLIDLDRLQGEANSNTQV
ncbi:MAG: PAS domain S-box protein [Leptolyngbyaceae cyanobacterium CRU_2_3]|nr:PAS domain S-box protein [Leptolyngbyaceae cyanobacterium CRU_2_3]